MDDELRVLDSLPADADHVTTEAVFTSHGWSRSGVGDWAVVLRSPSGDLAARISPFDDRIDPNPDNVMRRADGTLVLTDPFYAEGRKLYGSLLTDPSVVARTFPPVRRRHMFDLPLAESGPWDPAAREQMRAALAAADARLS